jgi:hypothetical protein
VAISIVKLLKAGMAACPLSILVFGPQLKPASKKPHVRALQKKRKQLVASLVDAGHEVILVEDLIDRSVSSPLDNAFVQEIAVLLHAQFDMIINLVHTSGTNVELGVIAGRKELAAKAQLFLCKDFSAGLSWAACKAAQSQGAAFTPYDYPKDISECHLIGKVLKRVEKVQLAKYLF